MIIMKNNKKRYLVVVEAEFVRDVQLADDVTSDPMETEGWSETTGEHVLGIFEGTDEGEAIGLAAVVAHLSGEMLKAYELAK